MSTGHEHVYDFVYRAMLAEEALDTTGRVRHINVGETSVAEALSFELFDEDLLRQARLMSTVYAAIAAFEMSVRRFIKKVLIDTHGEDWWDKGVSEKIRKFVDTRRTDEEKVKWHGVRGDDLLSYRPSLADHAAELDLLRGVCTASGLGDGTLLNSGAVA